MNKWTRDNTAQRVVHILKIAGYTQQELAGILDVAFVTVNRWVNGHTIPDRRSQKTLDHIELTYTKGDEQ